MAAPQLRVCARPAAPRCSGSARPNKAAAHAFLGILIYQSVKEPQGAVFCCRVRRHAFFQEFYFELTLVVIAAGVNSFGPDEYIHMSEENFFLRRRTSLSDGLQFHFQQK